MNSAMVGVVVIGRNEGERLRKCLSSLKGFRAAAYVDSGSTDGSQDMARTAGFDLVELDTREGFTAARARNAGAEHLLTRYPEITHLQFVDGDCEVRADWVDQALADMKPGVAAVFGRRRERDADRNLYHKACDIEWDIPQGEVEACGGDVLFLASALREANGYNPALIAGEEPELCHRLQARGWTIYCNAKEMTWHDVAIESFGQWWRRAKRAGFGLASLIDLHGPMAQPSWRRFVTSAVWWSAAAVAVLIATPLALLSREWTVLSLCALAATIAILAVSRNAWRFRQRFGTFGQAWRWSALLYISKLAQVQGVIEQRSKRHLSITPRIIEYK